MTKTEKKKKAHEYYLKNRTRLLEKQKRYYLTHTSEQRAWWKSNPDKVRAQHQRHYLKYRETIRATDNQEKKERRRICKQRAIEHYDSRCACCGETKIEFLTIDHINGGGKRHKKTFNGRTISEWLCDNNFPDGFRLLCMNCNFAFGQFGYCPHNRSIVDSTPCEATAFFGVA